MAKAAPFPQSPVDDARVPIVSERFEFDRHVGRSFRATSKRSHLDSSRRGVGPTVALTRLELDQSAKETPVVGLKVSCRITDLGRTQA